MGLNQLPGGEEIGVLLSMPDDQFAILGPIFIEELEKVYGNTNDRLMMAQALNASGLKLEDVMKSHNEICKELDERFKGIIAMAKIDFIKRLLAITYNAVGSTEGIATRKLLIPFEICREGAKMPTYAHDDDSGMDVYATEDMVIHPGETKLMPIGIKCAIPKGYELQVRPKSGRSLKSKLRVANTPGTVDSSYRGEIGVILENIDPVIREAEMDENGRLYSILWGSDIHIEKGEKIAQLVLSEVPKAILYEVDSIATFESDRGEGGYGSTGNK